MMFLTVVGLLIALLTALYLSTGRKPFTMWTIGFMSGLWTAKLIEVLYS